MSQAVVEVGQKVHIITRRLFKEDVRRHFVGTILAVSGYVTRVEGFVFVYSPIRMEYRKRPERRTRVFDLADAGHIVIVLPSEVEIDRIRYGIVEDRLVVMDGSGFTLDINEFNERQ